MRMQTDSEPPMESGVLAHNRAEKDNIEHADLPGSDTHRAGAGHTRILSFVRMKVWVSLRPRRVKERAIHRVPSRGWVHNACAWGPLSAMIAGNEGEENAYAVT